MRGGALHIAIEPGLLGVDEIMGLGGRRGFASILPTLANCTASRLRDKAAIQKEKRKATEELRLKRSQGTQGSGKQ